MDKNKDLIIDKTFNLALKNHQQNKLEEAKNLYNQVLEMNPNHSQAYYNQGLLFHTSGQKIKARKFYEKAIEIDPNNSSAHNNLGLIYGELGDDQKAKKFYEKAIEIDPNYTDPYNNLGGVFTILREDQKAINCYNKAIEINPNLQDAHNNLGVTFRELGENQKAKDCFKKAIEINPIFTSAHNNLGTIFFKLGKYNEAIACYEKAIEIDPNYVDAHNNLAVMYANTGHANKSVEYFHKALANRSKINFDIKNEKDLMLAPATSSFFLELTNKCNFHCEFCPSDSQTRLHGYMELSLVKKIFDEISQKKIVPVVNLHLMGEPTLHPKLDEILAYAKSKNVKVSLTTNGSTLVKKRVPILLDSISGSIIASLMTPTKETYKIRGDVGLSWDRYIDNFRLLIKEHLKKISRDDKIEYEIVFRVMVSSPNKKTTVKVLENSKSLKENYDQWSNFVEEVENELNLKPFVRQNIESDTTFSLIGDGLREVSFYLQKNFKIQFWKADTFANTRVSDEFKLVAEEKTQFCPHPFTDFGVLWNGDVSLCCLDYDATLKVGNVKNHSVEEILKNTDSNKLRSSMHGLEKLHPTCVKCQSSTIKR